MLETGTDKELDHSEFSKHTMRLTKFLHLTNHENYRVLYCYFSKAKFYAAFCRMLKILVSVYAVLKFC